MNFMPVSERKVTHNVNNVGLPLQPFFTLLFHSGDMDYSEYFNQDLLGVNVLRITEKCD